MVKNAHFVLKKEVMQPRPTPFEFIFSFTEYSICISRESEMNTFYWINIWICSLQMGVVFQYLIYVNHFGLMTK